MKLSFLFTLTLSLTCLCLFSQNNSYNDVKFICDSEKSIFISQFHGSGNIKQKSTFSLPSHFKETNSFWLGFCPAEDADLSFVIEPFDKKSDIDFIVFDSQLNPLRSILSGNEKGNYLNASCLDKVGLIRSDSDIFEDYGCDNSNGFANSLRLMKDETYFIWIHNYTNNHGFTFKFLDQINLSATISKSNSIAIVDSVFSVNCTFNELTDVNTFLWEENNISRINSNIASYAGKINNTVGQFSRVVRFNSTRCNLTDIYTVELVQGETKDSDEVFEFSLFPNPAKHKIKVIYTLNTNASHNLSIYSSNGVLFYKSIQDFNSSMNYAKEIETDNFAPGQYFLHIEHDSKLSIYSFTKI